MARPRSNSPQRKGKGTSFGKKSDAEKSFRKRSSGTRSGRGEFKPASRSYPKSEGDAGASFRPKSGGFRKTDGGRRDEDSRATGRFKRKPSDAYKPGNPNFRRNEGTPSRSNREERGDNEKRRFNKPASSSFEGGGNRREFKKPFRKTDDIPRSSRQEQSGTSEDHGREKSRFEKKDRKSFVQSRVVTSADFTRPGRKQEVIKEENVAKEAGLTRLNKFIANSGVGSRRQADELISMGLISVNGTTITTLGTKVKPGDVVRYEDRVLKAEKLVYILLNKPKGFITTTDDPQERNTVMGLVASACKERIYPVGRLDRNTTGLLFLTNDGDLAEKLTHPSYKAKKVYKVELDRPLTKNDFKKILDGVHLEEGRAMVDDLAIISEDDKTVGLEIHIGWNRVVRRIFETLGYDVVRLDRSVFAGMDKKDLSRGQWRFLKPEEIVRLKHFK